MSPQTLFGILIGATVALTALPASAEPANDAERKWSQPGYESPDEPLSTAPELDSFIGGPSDEDPALLDGDGRPLAQDASPER